MPQKIARIIIALAFALALGLPPARAAMKWLPVTDEDRAATASTIQPGAGAEILYHLKQVDDSEFESPVTDEYIRVKIHDESGVRALSKIDIPYENKTERIRNLAARVIKPDGSIIDVARKDFYDREIIKFGNVRVHVRSFAPPRLEPGAIVEYKWTLTQDTNIVTPRVDLAGEFPMRHVIFRVKPFSFLGFGSKVYYNQCAQTKSSRDKDGFIVIEMRDLPPVLDEPFAPPACDTRPWIMFYPALISIVLGWDALANAISEPLEKRLAATSRNVRDTAASIAGASSTPAEKLARLCDFCRTNIKNIDYLPPDGATDPKLAKKQNRTADDILKTKLATSADLQFLLIALARAAGFDARAALCSNRAVGSVRRDLLIPYLLPDPIVAVKLDNDWKFYDPAHSLVPSGKLRWQNSQATALIIKPGANEWRTTPPLSREDSLVKRTGTFRLNEQGALSGSVRIEYGAAAGADTREEFFKQPREKIEQLVRERVQSRLPLAEVSDVRAENTDDPLKPLALAYTVTAPGYAEITGQRLLVQPSFFEKGKAAMFTADTRDNDIFFNYPIDEKDDVTMKIPPRFKIEAGSSPGGIEKADWGQYRVAISLKKSTNEILYSRELEFSWFEINAARYPQIKSLFDEIHERDAHLLTLRADATNEGKK